MCLFWLIEKMGELRVTENNEIAITVTKLVRRMHYLPA
jgi:hypothetical protein